MSGEVDFGEAVTRVIDAGPGAGQLESKDLEVVQRELAVQLASRFPTLGDADRSDVIADALIRLIAAARSGAIDPKGNPAGYLWRIAENRAHDLLRRPQFVPLDDTAEPQTRAPDDEIATLLEAAASSADIKAAMRLAREDGEHGLVKTISSWLVLAERIGRAPTTREAGQALDMSHDTVARRLRRFGEYLAKVMDDR
jgi:DNA-directed RNA polymerase specialized sigma24 family protein